MTALLIASTLGLALQGGPEPGPKPAPADDLPSPADLFALYRANVDTFATLTVQWRRDHAYSDAWLAHDTKELDAMAKAVEALNAADADSTKLGQQLDARLRSRSSNTVARRMDQLFQTNRAGFLLRTAPIGWDVGLPGDPPAMPEVSITEATLRSTYADYQLVSHPEPRHGGYLQVSANGAGGPVSAMLRRQNFSDGRNDLPPLGTRDDSWGATTRHPIDAFFGNDPSEFRTVGKSEVDGREVIVIERRGQSAEATPKGPQIEVVRAFIDPKRGGLPLRIEWDHEPSDGGPPRPVAKSDTPEHLLVVGEVVEVEGAGSYPSKGSMRVFGELEQAPAPRVLFEETTWSASLVRANAPLPSTLAAIPIPDGTYYFDEYRGTSVKAGQEDRNHAIVPWSLCGAIVVGWGGYGALALIRGSLRRSRGAATA